MNKKFLIILIILIVAGIVAILYTDIGTKNEQLSINFDKEWKGYYEVSLNENITHEKIEGDRPLNFTIKRDKGDKLKVFVKSTANNSSGYISIIIYENGKKISENSSSNPSLGVGLIN